MMSFKKSLAFCTLAMMSSAGAFTVLSPPTGVTGVVKPTFARTRTHLASTNPLRGDTQNELDPLGDTELKAEFETEAMNVHNGIENRVDTFESKSSRQATAMDGILQSVRLASLAVFALPLYVILVVFPKGFEQVTQVKQASSTMDAATVPVDTIMKNPLHRDGILSPIVKAAKNAMGEAKLNKVRGKVIELHSNVIKGWVGTSETQFGQAALKSLYRAADADRNGTIDEVELERAFRALGFGFLKEKQVKGIFARADVNRDGRIDLEEFLEEAPKVLRTNLVKLAKKNGGEMGLLA